MENKNFGFYKKQIEDALNNKMRLGDIKFDEEVFLFDGFFMQSFQDTLQGIQLGGKSIPSILLIGKRSGRLYYLAIKAILPDIQI